MAQYVFSMHRLGKAVPPKRQILQGHLPVLLPRRQDRRAGPEWRGQVHRCCGSWRASTRSSRAKPVPMPGRQDWLPAAGAAARPGEDRARDRRGSGMAEVNSAKARLEEVYAAYAEPDADFDALAEEQGRAGGHRSAAAGHDSEHQLEIAADALRLPAWDAKIGQSLRWRKTPRGAVQAAAVRARHAAAGRTDQPPGRRVGRLAGAVPAPLPRHRGGRSPTTATSSTTPPSGFWNWTVARAFPRRATTPTGWSRKQARLEQEAKSEEATRTKAMKQELEWVRQNAKGRQAKSKARIARFEETERLRIPETQ